jgi:GPH family glycoside/pentoside/hexuronide:cation symporter
MLKHFHFRILTSELFKSHVKLDNVNNTERWLGFFIGPSLIATVAGICGNTYLNVFYTDVLKMSPVMGGLFLVSLPIITRIINAATNLIMGRIIDNTDCVHGKARPWLLISGPLLAISCILLFTVPVEGIKIQVIWIIASYNLFFCVSYTVYNNSNTLMVPLSTRNVKQRDTLAIVSSMSFNMIPGIIITILFPMIFLPYMSVDQNRWKIIMCMISALSVPGILLQYFFTRERVTEEARIPSVEKHIRTWGEQLKGCFLSKYWLIVMGIITIFMMTNNFFLSSLLYYSNWVLGSYNDGRTYTILNAVGQFPLGFGLLFLWPLVKKTGKRGAILGGGILFVVGSMICLLNSKNMVVVLAGLMIRSFGNLPLTYTQLAILADSLDHVEKINGFRCDGISSSIYNIIFTVSSGIAIGIFNLFLKYTGYTAPATDGGWVQQSIAVQNFFVYGVFLVPAAGMVFIFILMLFFNVEKDEVVSKLG